MTVRARDRGHRGLSDLRRGNSKVDGLIRRALERYSSCTAECQHDNSVHAMSSPARSFFAKKISFSVPIRGACDNIDI